MGGLLIDTITLKRVEFEISRCKLAEEEEDVKDVCVEVWESGGKESE